MDWGLVWVGAQVVLGLELVLVVALVGLGLVVVGVQALVQVLVRGVVVLALGQERMAWTGFQRKRPTVRG